MFGYLGGRTGRDRLYDCHCELQLLDNPQAEILTSFDKISGRIVLTAYSKVFFKSLWIQLEGNATARFKTKIDNRMTNHLKTERFIPEENSDSGACIYLIGRKPSYSWKETEKVSVERGSHIYPFEIKLNGQQLPATFQSPYGRIQYKLVCYAISLRETYWHEVAAVEKILKTKGYLNLSLDSQLLKPLVITRTKEKSIFSRRPIIKLNLVLDQRGFLPGEQFDFQLILENSSGEDISRIEIAFVQKIIYFNNKISKSTLALLDELESDFDTCDGEMHWDFSINIPTNLMPTFSKERKTVEILYFLQFAVLGRGKSHLKGETPIVIGTTKEMPATAEILVPQPRPADSERERPASTNSMWDAISIQTCSTLPPTYSEAASRRPSLETLPPMYDLVVGDDNWDNFNQEFRPRSSSNAM